MPSAELLTRPEEVTTPLQEGTYSPEIIEAQTDPEIPVPGPGDFVLHRTSKFGHIVMTKMHISSHPQYRINR